jgi:hypothetical protein
VEILADGAAGVPGCDAAALADYRELKAHSLSRAKVERGNHVR